MPTREEFFACPHNWWYYRWYNFGGKPIPDEWIASAWEDVQEFRDIVTYEFMREARKVGEIDQLTEDLQFLDSILPLHRMVEIFVRVREHAPLREPEFRPTFERVFGERMMAFPTPLSAQEFEEESHPCDVPETGGIDDEIPF